MRPPMDVSMHALVTAVGTLTHPLSRAIVVLAILYDCGNSEALFGTVTLDRTR